SVEVIGKITNISPIREFNKGDRKGRVQSVTIGDETGQIRVVLWNDKVDLTKELKEGQVIRVKQGYTKANTFGMPEIHLSAGSTMEQDEKEIEVAKKEEKQMSHTFSGNLGERKKLKDIQENDFIECRGAIVSISEREYLTCPECKSKLEEISGTQVCKDHGKVEPDKNLLIKGFLDDGTSTIRFVAFRELAEQIKKDNLIGKDVIFTGRIKRNEYFGDLEMMLNKAGDVDVDKEISMLNSV
ncbi:MAG: hypothetical protein KAU95_01600, partial [Candidatus Aenigmarchaeota archaeon]|nr:hypothetical protein [Candidatus Aenigmarchaeota archaeon]